VTFVPSTVPPFYAIPESVVKSESEKEKQKKKTRE
jgi:hypothetical protein